MEPTDQLDASNRRLPESRLERFAKRRSAFRHLRFSSQLSRFNHFLDPATWLLWLLMPGFGAHRDNLRDILKHPAHPTRGFRRACLRTPMMLSIYPVASAGER